MILSFQNYFNGLCHSLGAGLEYPEAEWKKGVVLFKKKKEKKKFLEA